MAGSDCARQLLMGNEAIARGALEGGARFCSGYPGNPSSEIIDTLLKTAPGTVHVEWSVNEMVALEAAAAASFAGLRSLCAMKQNGINVCADFLISLALTGMNGGGLVLVVCDDPGPLTSSNEEDSRRLAPLCLVPLLEPATPQEAKDMTSWALGYSADNDVPVLLRSVNRLSHGRAGVVLGPLPAVDPVRPRFDVSRPLLGLPQIITGDHYRLIQKLGHISEEFDTSPFNAYVGPRNTDLLVVTAGLGFLYAQEAIARLGLSDRVGILKLGTVYPFPARLVADRLRGCRRVLVVEQIEPFVEEQVRLVHSEHASELEELVVFGKRTGHILTAGEIDTDAVQAALGALVGPGEVEAAGARAKDTATRAGTGVDAPLGSAGESADKDARAEVLRSLPPRDISFCQGCPHRASFWAINTALALDGRDGFVTGDIGCYGLAAGPTGYSLIKTQHCMGSSIGCASGFGVLGKLGFEQPVVAVAGDSTFYHACLPALINAQVQQADLVFVILDNLTTAMTGFQPNPGSASTPADPNRKQIRPEDICRALGVDTVVVDPVEDVEAAMRAVYAGLQERGVQVVVMRRVCATFDKKGKETTRRMRVDQEKCVGEDCGCDRFCTSVLGCVGNRWDAQKGKAYIEQDYCNACGLCAQLCPRGAIGYEEEPRVDEARVTP